MRSLWIVGLLAGLLLIAAPSASAHATIELRGERPVAGTRGTLTMTIPHGCGVDRSTDRLVVRLGSAWGRVRPVAPAGWSVSVARATSGRWTITWRATAGRTASVPSPMRWRPRRNSGCAAYRRC